MKAYKLYDIENQRIFISRDVLFHEAIFPFHQITSHSEAVDHFPNLVLPNIFGFSGVQTGVTNITNAGVVPTTANADVIPTAVIAPHDSNDANEAISPNIDNSLSSHDSNA